MNPPRILIAGIGNIFLGDDAFGSEVARILTHRPVPSGIRVTDFGIRGLDLTYALLDDYDAAILVDATQRGSPPGTLYVIEPEPVPDGDSLTSERRRSHHGPRESPSPGKLHGEPTKRVLLVGCEPATFGSDHDPVMGLSEPVTAAVADAIYSHRFHPRRLIAESPDFATILRQPSRMKRRQPPCWKILAGFFLGILNFLVLGLVGVIFFIPDAGRYLRIKSM